MSAMSGCGSYAVTTSRRQVNGRAEHPNVTSCCEEEWSLVGCGGGDYEGRAGASIPGAHGRPKTVEGALGPYRVGL